VAGGVPVVSYEGDALARDGMRCFRCGLLVPAGPRNCLHRLAERQGGPDTLDNRITLCGWGNNLRGADGETWCHGWVHQNGRAAREAGWIISQHDVRTPGQVPVAHHELGLVYLTADGRMLPEGLVVAWSVGGHLPLTEGDVANMQAERGAYRVWDAG